MGSWPRPRDGSASAEPRCGAGYEPMGSGPTGTGAPGPRRASSAAPSSWRGDTTPPSFPLGLHRSGSDARQAVHHRRVCPVVRRGLRRHHFLRVLRPVLRDRRDGAVPCLRPPGLVEALAPDPLTPAAARAILGITTPPGARASL